MNALPELCAIADDDDELLAAAVTVLEDAPRRGDLASSALPLSRRRSTASMHLTSVSRRPVDGIAFHAVENSGTSRRKTAITSLAAAAMRRRSPLKIDISLVDEPPLARRKSPLLRDGGARVAELVDGAGCDACRSAFGESVADVCARADGRP